MTISNESPGAKRRPDLTCPLCRRALTASRGPDGAVFECAGAHVFSSQSLLQEHSRQSFRLLREMEELLEAKIVVSTELAARAVEDGRHHLSLYLENEIEDAVLKMAVVQPCLREEAP